MPSVIRFKYRSGINWEDIYFEGNSITVGELKQLIADMKNLGDAAVQQLIVNDASTRLDLTDPSTIIWPNSRVELRRIPLARSLTLQQAQAIHTESLSSDLGQSFPEQVEIADIRKICIQLV